jgi:hypothetical protein
MLKIYRYEFSCKFAEKITLKLGLGTEKGHGAAQCRIALPVLRIRIRCFLSEIRIRDEFLIKEFFMTLKTSS